MSFDEVLDLAKRSETSIYTIALRGSRRAGQGLREVEFVMRTLAQETGGAFFPAKIEDLDGVQANRRRPASQYTLGYTSANPSRRCVARIVVQVSRPNITPRRRRVLRPDSPLPASPRSATPPTWCTRFISRSARRPSDARPPHSPAGVLAHTFVIGMQTMEVRHVPFSNTSTAVSSFVWMLALSYLYLEVTTDERAMGVFIVPILGRLQPSP